MMKTTEVKEIHKTIRELGITPRYKGYHYLVEATTLYLSLAYYGNEYVLITKDVYPEVSKRCKTTTMSVERSIRTAIDIWWETNKETMQKLLECKLNKKPTNIKFIDLLAYKIFTTN